MSNVRYREFFSGKELYDEMVRHQPVGYLVRKDRKDSVFKIVKIENVKKNFCCIVHVVPGNLKYYLDHLFLSFTFVDGTPLGVLVNDK